MNLRVTFSIGNELIKSALLRASSVYAIISALDGFVSFLVLPILTRYLTPEDYGLASMFSLLVSIFGIFVGLGTQGAVNRAYFEQDINFKEYVFNCIVILLFGSLLTLIVTLIFVDTISLFSTIPVTWVIFAVIVSSFDFITYSVLSIYQARMAAKKYAVIQALKTMLSAALSIILIIVVGMRWEGRVIGQSSAIIAISLIGLLILKSWVKWKLCFRYVRHALAFGVPLIPHALGGMLMVYTDRFIITNTLGVEKTGIYVVGWQVGNVISILADAFNKAYAPWLFARLNNDNQYEKSRLVKLTYLYYLLILSIAISLGLFAPFMIRILLGKDFHGSSPVVLWIAIGGAFTGMYYMVVNYIFYTRKTYILAIITFTSGIFNAVFTYLFVIRFGVIGASYSYALTCFFQFLLTWMLAGRLYEMPWIKFGA